MNEEEKMKQGQWYDANDEELCRQRMHAKDLCFCSTSVSLQISKKEMH